MASQDSTSAETTTAAESPQPAMESPQPMVESPQPSESESMPAESGQAGDTPMADGMDVDGIIAMVGEFIATMPEWATIAIAAGAAAFFGTLVGSRIGRGRVEAPAQEPPPMAPPGGEAEVSVAAPENPAFRSLQKILEARGISAKDQDTRMREFAGQFEDMRRKLQDLIPGGEHLKPLVRGALDSLESGHFQRTIEFMEKVASSDGEAGRKIREQADKHLTAAATAKVVAGDLKMAETETEAAMALYREAVEFLPPLAEELLAEYLNKYGTAAYQSGDHETATAAFERSLRHLERTLGGDHADVATALNNLALLYYSRGNMDRAEPLYRRALEIDEKILGPDDTGVATDLNNLALLYKKKGDVESAEPLLKRALEIKEKNFDPGHPSLVTGLKNYASVLKALGRGEEARGLEERASALPPKRTEAAE